MSPNIVVNCEKSNTRRPSSSISGNICIKSSSLAEVVTALASFSDSSRGSQQVCLSLSKASSIVMWLLASP